MRRTLRLARLAAHLCLGALACGLLYPALRRPGRMAVRRWWCRGLLAALGIRLQVQGAGPLARGLIAANHVSWLDPVVLGALFPCGFVAKAETRSWPLVGWLAALNETLFLRRGCFRAALRMRHVLAGRLAERRAVAIFPEGTTSNGTTVLPFRGALFQAAIDGGHPVLPVAIRYHDGRGGHCGAASFVGETPLLRSLLAVAGEPALEARILLCRPIATRRVPRKAVASLARAAVSEALGASLDELRAAAQPLFVPQALEVA